MKWRPQATAEPIRRGYRLTGMSGMKITADRDRNSGRSVPVLLLGLAGLVAGLMTGCGPAAGPASGHSSAPGPGLSAARAAGASVPVVTTHPAGGAAPPPAVTGTILRPLWQG